MSKAILVMDMPDSCLDCRFCREIDEGIEACCEIMDEPDNSSLCRMIEDYCQCRPNWCPLKEMPKKSYTGKSDYCQRGDWEDGWNACIDEAIRRIERSFYR